MAVFGAALGDEEIPDAVAAVEVRPLGTAAPRARADVARPLEDGAALGVDDGKRDALLALGLAVRAEPGRPVLAEMERGIDAADGEGEWLRPGSADGRRRDEEVAEPVDLGAGEIKAASMVAEGRREEAAGGRGAGKVEL
jgi:hypothetical protein